MFLTSTPQTKASKSKIPGDLQMRFLRAASDPLRHYRQRHHVKYVHEDLQLLKPTITIQPQRPIHQGKWKYIQEVVNVERYLLDSGLLLAAHSHIEGKKLETIVEIEAVQRVGHQSIFSTDLAADHGEGKWDFSEFSRKWIIMTGNPFIASHSVGVDLIPELTRKT